MKIVNETTKTKRKRHNKNKKKAWRKKIDISDVEEFLDKKRCEERLRTPLDERLSEELFTLDSQIWNNGQSVVNKEPKKTKFLSKNGLKPANHAKTTSFKCHQFINGLPGAKAISKKKGVMKQRVPRKLKMARKLSRNTLMSVAKKNEVFEQRNQSLAQKRQILKTDNFDKDIWACTNKKELEKFDELGRSFVEDGVKFYKVQTKAQAVKTPSIRFMKPSLLPPVVIPQPGASYNPSYEDHQHLLAEACEIEDKKIKKEEKERMLIKKYLPKAAAARRITDDERMAELAEGLPIFAEQREFEDELQNDESQEGEDTLTCGSQRRKEKKRAQVRRKAKTIKIEEQQRLKKKAANLLESNVLRVKSYGRELDKEEKKQKIERKKKIKKREEDRYKTKQLSQYKFEEEDVMVPLEEELSGSIREITPMGNAMESLYKNFQRRNIIEKRVRVKKSKPKIKSVIKRSKSASVNNFLNSLTTMLN